MTTPDPPNPFAPPQVISQPDVAVEPPGAVPIYFEPYRDGLFAVVAPGVPLPNRCVYCNQPGARVVPYKFVWRQGLGEVSVLRTGYSLCDLHASRAKWRIPLVMLGLVFGIFLAPIFVSLLLGDRLVAAWLPLLLAVWMAAGVAVVLGVDRWCGRIVSAAIYQQGRIFLSGCREPFLQSLPDGAAGNGELRPAAPEGAD